MQDQKSHPNHGLILFEPPRQVTKEQCIFYHSIDLPDGETIQGDWDMRGRFGDYIGHVNVRGKRLLDVGTASGFLSFEAEGRGASVISLDADSTCRYTRLPFPKYWNKDAMAKVIQEDNVWLDKVKNSYWYAHTRLGSRNKVYYGNILDLPEELGTFDIIVVGQFLVHNRSAAELLESLAKICTGTMIITEGVIQEDRPIAQLLADPKRPDRWYEWWLYSRGFYKNMLGVMGFEVTAFSRNYFKCNASGYPSEIELTTIVAESRADTRGGNFT